MYKRPFLLVLILFVCFSGKAQFLMDMVDTSKEMGKGMLLLYKKFDHIRMGGYIQPQFQASGSKGAKSFNGGDFAANVNNRFMLRRGRVRFDYIHFAEAKGPSVQFVLQFDGTEKGVFIRDFWGRLLENKFQLFSVTAGMFARPFGYEVNLSSADRESPERGRMSQILMKSERDLGAMLSLEPRKKGSPLQHIKLDIAFFNGQGLSATTDFDSHKDIVVHLGLKPIVLAKNFSLSAGISVLQGGMLQSNKYVYRVASTSTGSSFVIDSSESNAGSIAPRKYYGADLQLKYSHNAVSTQFRAEYIAGTQTGTELNSETPIALLKEMEGHYIRQFNGAYFYLLQQIFNTNHQLGIKYDWYDANTGVKGAAIGKPGTRLGAADIKFSTIGFGYNYSITENVKLLLWYDKVFNEKTALDGYVSDAKDDVFTCRLQFRF